MKLKKQMYSIAHLVIYHFITATNPRVLTPNAESIGVFNQLISTNLLTLYLKAQRWRAKSASKYNMNTCADYYSFQQLLIERSTADAQ